jgi:PhzF family phenazine biosynthesis protein
VQALIDLERETGAGTTIFCRAAEDPTCTVRLRSFAPGAGVPGDPVCGSGNGCVGAYLARSRPGDLPIEYRAEQGIEVARPGRVFVRVEADGASYRVQVGGRATTVADASLRL